MKNHKYILFVGRIDPIKGFEILLEMAQILKKKNDTWIRKFIYK